MIWLLRLVLLSFLLFMFYRLVKYFFTPQRKLESARKHKKFLLLDYDEVIKNLHLTYNGCLFTGEKYLGSVQNKTEVVSISLRLENITALKGMSMEDFYYIEKKILEKYPAASINWQSPIGEFLNQQKKPHK
nr:sigma-w pathway protein ysdB [Neobacillus sp. Marseille-Q6967]